MSTDAFPRTWSWHMPNALGAWQRAALVALLSAPSMVAGLLLAWAGAWPPLFFAVLQVIGLCIAFGCVERHRDDYERLTVDEHEVTLECRCGAEQRTFRFVREWVTLDCRFNAHRTRCVLALVWQGRATFFGRHMNDTERLALVPQLAARIRTRTRADAQPWERGAE